MMRVLLLIAVSLVLVSAAKIVLLHEVERSIVRDAVTWVFTTTNSKYRDDVFLLKSRSIVQRRADGTHVVTADFSSLPYQLFNPRRAAISPDGTILALAWVRNTTAQERQWYVAQTIDSVHAATEVSWFGRNATNNGSIPAPKIITISTIALNTTTGVAIPSTWQNTSITIPIWDDTQFDLGDFKFDNEGFLWVGTGNTYPQYNNTWDYFQEGRKPANLQGKILKIDLTKPDGAAAGNPFINSNTNPAVWATGFSWPTAFQWTTDGSLWATDFNSGIADELNKVVRAADHGWNVLEGDTCILPPVGCPKTNHVPPQLYVNVPAAALSAALVYGAMGLADIGDSTFIAAWNGSETTGIIRQLSPSTNTVTDLEVVDARGVDLMWYYGRIQFVQLTRQNLNAPIYVLGSYPGNSSSVLFRAQLVEGKTSGAAQISIIAALILALIIALLH